MARRKIRFAIFYKAPSIGIGEAKEPMRRQWHPSFQSTAHTLMRNTWSRRATHGTTKKV